MNFWVVFVACFTVQLIFGIIGFLFGVFSDRETDQEIEKMKEDNKKLDEDIAKLRAELDEMNADLAILYDERVQR